MARAGAESVRSRCSLIFFFGEAYFLLFPPQLDQIAEIFCTHLGQPTFAAANNGFDKPFFTFDHLINLFFQRTHGNILMHLNITLLPNSEGPVGSLVFDGRVPPAIKMENMVSARQV